MECWRQITERLTLLPSTALRKAFVEHVHVPLLADYCSRLLDEVRSWRRGRQGSGDDTRAAHYRLGCAVHNSANLAAASLRGWGEEMFFLGLSAASSGGLGTGAAAALARASAEAAASVTFFEVDRPGSAEEWRGCAKTMVSSLADAIIDEVTAPLDVYLAASISQGLFWVPPEAEGQAEAVSVELLQLLSDLGATLRQCEAELADRAWSALRRAVARQLDGLVFEQMLCELHCTRAGLEQLQCDLSALFGVFDASPSSAGRQRAAGGGASLFRRSSDTLALLRLPAAGLESLQSSLWPDEAGSEVKESAMEALGLAGVKYLDTEDAKLTHGAWPRVYQ